VFLAAAETRVFAAERRRPASQPEDAGALELF